MSGPEERAEERAEELTAYAERVLFSADLADKLRRPDTFTDTVPGPAVGAVSLPARPPGLALDSLRSTDNFSIVVTKRPSASASVTRQERSASPSMSTMQAPQSPCPQPNLVPVRFDASRSAQSKGVCGTMRYSTGRSLTVSLVMHKRR